MKRLITLCLLTMATQIFANDYVCPTSFKCSILNDRSSCVPADGSPEFNVIIGEGRLAPDTYKFSGAIDDYGASNALHRCFYSGVTTPSQFYVYSKNLKLYPNWKIAGSTWRIGADWVDCDSSPSTHILSPATCVFTDQYMTPHSKSVL